MNEIHPNASRAVFCALAAVALAANGCKSTSTGVNNPFLAPDRVAPPSTRALAPGQAQPYYPGDPLPIMQSATTPPANNLATNNTAVETQSSTGTTLTWNATGGSAPPAPAAPTALAAANAAPPWDTTPKAAAPIARGNEPAVSVPADAGELRFPLPAPISPEAAAPVVATAAPNSAPNSAPGQAVVAAQNPQPQGVSLASYNAPVAPGLTPAAAPPTLVPTPQAGSPWRTPQVGQGTQPPTAPMYGMPAPPPQAAAAQPMTLPPPPATFPPTPQPPMAAPTNAVAVQLRSVPPPPPQPGDPMPRIRFPGYEVPQTAATDGFRPRSTMR